jgi:bacillolysin
MRMHSGVLCFLALVLLFPMSLQAQFYPGGGIGGYTSGRPVDKYGGKATKAQVGALERMQRESETPLQVRWNNQTGVPYLVSGTFALRDGATEEIATRNFFKRNRSVFRMSNPESDLKLVRNEKDSHGFRHLRYTQRYRGIPVYGGDVVAHFDRRGALRTINGSYLPDVSIDIVPRFTAEDATRIAMIELGITADDLHNTLGPELMIYPKDGAYYLTWCLTLVAAKPFAEWKCFVDAEAGVLLDAWNDTKYEGPVVITGTGTLGNTLSVYGYERYWHETVQTGFLANSYWPVYGWWAQGYYWDTGIGLVDTSKAMFSGGSFPFNGAIHTRNLHGYDVNEIGYMYYYTCDYTPGNWCGGDQSLASYQCGPQDISCHYNMEKVYDYWKDHFNRNSVDNKGMNMYGTVDWYGWSGAGPNNAMWTTGVYGLPEGGTFFGQGDGITALAQGASLDTVAHEFTHGVTQYSCNLEYRNQSGAINEGFSDSFACACTYATTGAGDWYLYNDEGCWLVSPGYLRNIRDPHQGYNADPYPFGAWPADMDEYVETDDDNGGVHINMCIVSRVFYLICEAIGVSKGEQIWYRTQTQYCTTTTNFVQLRDLALQACTDLYGSGAEYSAVVNAFSTVGIGGMSDGGILSVSPGEWLNITIDIPSITDTPAGYFGYSVVTLPTGGMLTVLNSAIGPFHGPLTRVAGLPGGYSGTIYNGPVPSGVAAGEYVFKVALIRCDIPQGADTSSYTYYSSLTVDVQ